MDSILVTGGAGFIGSHVVDLLLKKGKKVICVDNFNTYYNPKIKEDNIKEHIKNPNYKLFRVDITNKNKLEQIFKENKIDTIIHLAARAGVRPSIEHPELYESSNLKGTLNLLELAKQFSIKKFIFASSSSVYGSRTNVPFRETDNVDFPISQYAATKKAGEMLCYVYHHLYGMDIACLRFFTVYGPRGRPDMAPLKFTELIAKGKEIEIYGDGTAKRDFTYVEDITKGVVSASEKIKGYEIINLGDSNPVEVNYFISLIEKELNKKAIKKYSEPKQGDVPLTYADISKAKKLLDYNPSTPIEQGIKKLVEWYKNIKKEI